ncbi:MULTISPECIES: nitrite/sulfite reductase [Romboutsia]|uniref:nitrite/sulfite reductase n=1 Tax=Romboutsia TaxID=1501226 RepID=UPI0018A90C34|nr:MULTISPECIES: nitrite/sulfite reductase [Romboutsia]MCH1958979.1 nitrite/sulfite reductase [Romboutsia hominis]MCH1968103.1 nitrite/sulfite reductase [Romboutsia hominis]MDB8794845.1 nitrite/sulfite reductase [Romboutsia sp. 1001216sp1]MDB8797698.1 nitrite/sulfite reductase [Romboutsia sp. 1001216sp1]MDB8800520.1 nitrite/sulfite reductase [Romboutsia sp. 1001216sp1]
MEELRDILLNEIPEFREKGHKFVNGEISVNEFKHASGGMGVYAHRGGKEFMIRLRTASGVLDIEKLKYIYDCAKKYNLDKVHLTTRQAIQLHGLGIDEVCDIMEDGLKHGIYTRGGGGNFPRNVALSPLSGVEIGEAFDVTEYALKVNEYLMKDIYKYKLPRKLKVSFSNSSEDTANCTVQDLGFLAVKENGEEFFKLYIAGGIGKNPAKAVEYDELVPKSDVLYHVQAMIELFIAEGNYENRNKARTRYIVASMGEEEFLKCYKKHLKEVKERENLDLNIENKTCKKQGSKIDLQDIRLIPQKQEGLYSVYLHPIGGQLKLTDLEALINALESIEDLEIRLSMSEGVYFRNLNGEEAKNILELTKTMGGNTPIEQTSCCIGVPTCQIGIGESQGLLHSILDYFKKKNYTTNKLPRIHISGCTSSCGTHQIGIIGFGGKKKKIDGELKEAFTLYVGGVAKKDNVKLGEVYGDIASDKIPEFLYNLGLLLDEKNINFEEYLGSNVEEFKEFANKYIA